MTGGTTLDGFLGGRLTIEQPKRGSGFRAGHDSVLLAASVRAGSGEYVLELGSGAGVVGLCLAARVPGVRVLGVEIDTEMAVLANSNATRNALSDRVRFVAGDAREVLLPDAPFSHIVFNPPFHLASGHVSPNANRDRARRDTDNALKIWTDIARSLVETAGTITIVTRADRFEEWCGVNRGTIEWIPILSHEGDAPKRIIARLYPGGDNGKKQLPAIVLHGPDGQATEAAERLLRHGDGLQ